jgi:hypothetical protein
MEWYIEDVEAANEIISTVTMYRSSSHLPSSVYVSDALTVLAARGVSITVGLASLRAVIMYSQDHSSC